ncbi:MAG TPA: SusD/RagB family nutrient-binding outer membrane lipoprotein [Chitinophagaceae bacterium]|nr:SusD/RagB family nutrient-binding outer membrane lipoprotein [Chitinophagaceae bacterium]
MKKYILFFATATVVLAGCKKNYLDLNENPNLPSTVSAASLLAAAEVRTAGIMVDPSASYFNVWMDQWAFSPNYAVSQDIRDYKFTNAFQQGLFADFYSNGFDYQKMIDFAIAQKNPALEGIGRTMKSMLMQYAVDVYNNVPYSEAFKGANNQTPVYDDAKTVYEAIYNDLNLAVAKFDSAQASQFPTATQDIMFGGDKGLWIKLANTIKLRILLRQSARGDRASYIAQHVAADFPDGLSSFLGQGEIAQVNPGFTNADTKQNPYWASFGYSASGSKTGNNDYFKAAAYAVSFYTGQNDIRGFFAEKPVGSGSGSNSMFGYLFRGNEMGIQGLGTQTYSDNLDNLAGDLFGVPDQTFRSPADPQPIVTDFESLFLQAEAVQRGWFTGDAQTLYDEAVQQSFNYMFDHFYAGAGADAYAVLNPDPRNDWASATDKIQLIITQKWAALNTLNFFEPWAEYRRTGFPNVPLSSSLSRGPHIPWRLKYPQNEYDLNGKNVSAQGDVDQFTSKIWWMP